MTEKKKKQLNLFGDMRKTKKWYRNLSIIDKRILFTAIGIFFLILMINLTIEAIRNYDNDLSQSECNLLIKKEVRQALSLQEENKWLEFIYAFQLSFIILIGAISISWVLHGVQFKIIGRVN
jgi:hypothetical protein|tara:strand:- start:275 stop:640 length:366 start_codon:yes stop_codon:yes gene_type:complete